jgi:hypothetical protein
MKSGSLSSMRNTGSCVLQAVIMVGFRLHIPASLLRVAVPMGVSSVLFSSGSYVCHPVAWLGPEQCPVSLFSSQNFGILQPCMYS